MTLFPRLAALQERLVDRVKQAAGSTDQEVAAMAGVDRTAVVRWRSGDREISLGHLRGLILGLGDARPVLQELAELGGCDVTRREPVAASDIEGETLEAAECSTRLARIVHSALSDGRINKSEATEISKQLEEILGHLNCVRGALPREKA